MLENLQSRIKRKLLVVMICIGGVVGCGKIENNSSVLESENIIQFKKNGTEMETVEKCVSIIENILSCSKDTAESVFKIINDHIDGDITEIEKEWDEVYTRLKVKDDEANTYIVFIGRGYFVEKIYRNDEFGERIYRAMR